jgi:hypothetical protein
MNDRLPTATSVVKDRFIGVSAGNTDLLAVLHVCNGAASNGLFHGLFDVSSVSLQEALAIDRALVLAVQTAVDHVTHTSPPG